MKLTLAPALVAGTTLVARRWGALLGGVVGGFPAVVGPILIALDAQHGDAFATRAAAGALAGLISLTAFILAYGWIARRLSWPATLAVSWAVFALATAALDGVDPRSGVAFPVVLVCFVLAWVAMPRSDDLSAAAAPPRFDLAMRVVATAAFVVILTAAAGALGPQLSGLLAAFPILASVLAAFIHAQDGAGAASEFLRGLLGGLAGFASFCFVVAQMLPDTGPVAAFAVATAVAVVVNGSLAVAAGRRVNVHYSPASGGETDVRALDPLTEPNPAAPRTPPHASH